MSEPITPHVIQWIKTLFSFEKKIEKNSTWDTWIDRGTTDNAKEEGIKLIEKNKQDIMTEGNAIEDARQKLGEFIQYWYKAKLNEENADSLVVLFPILEEIIKLETSKYNKKIGKCYRIVGIPEKVILDGTGPKSVFFGSFSTEEEARFNIHFLRVMVDDVVWRYRVYIFYLNDELRRNLDSGLVFSDECVNNPDLRKFLLV